ncbi:MAG: YveK family protein [Chloroflexota bacterium]
MRVVDVLAALRRRWLVILACALICGGVAGVYSKVTTRIYRAATTISVTPAKFDYGNGLAAQNLLSNYAENITGQQLLGQLDTQLKLDISPDILAHMITATSDNNSLTISLTVDDTDASRAAAIANTLTQLFITKQTEYNLSHLNPDVDVQVVHSAAVPGSPNKPKSKTNVLAGLLLGFLLGCGAAYVLDVWDDRLRTEHDIEAGLAMGLLGNLPHFRGVPLPPFVPPGANGHTQETNIQQPVSGARR